MPNKTSHEVKRFMILISEEKLQSYLIDKQFRIVRHIPYAGELLTTIDGYEDIITTGIAADRIIYSRELSEDEKADFNDFG